MELMGTDPCLSLLNKLEEEKAKQCHSLWLSFLTIPCYAHPHQIDTLIQWEFGSEKEKPYLPPLPCDQEYTSGMLREGFVSVVSPLQSVFSCNF